MQEIEGVKELFVPENERATYTELAKTLPKLEISEVNKKLVAVVLHYHQKISGWPSMASSFGRRMGKSVNRIYERTSVFAMSSLQPVIRR